MKHSPHFFAFVVWGALFAAGLTKYPGSAITYAVFSLSFLALLISGLYRQVSYGYTFLSVFLWLGFWLKLTVHLILNYAYTEPVGLFDGTPSAWDAVLKISVVACAGLLASRVGYAFASTRGIPILHDTSFGVPGWYLPRRKWLWGGLIVIMVVISALNAIFGVHQIGLIPRTIFPWPANSVIAWSLNIGVSIVLSTMICWDIRAGLNVFAPLLAVICEAFASTVSILSRGTFLYHAIPVAFGLAKNRRLLVPLPRLKYVLLAVVFWGAFLGSLYLVGVLRNYYYSDAPVPAGPSVRLSAIAKQVVGLSVDRWIGLEGVMAVYGYPKKGSETLLKAITEKRVTSESPMYEHISLSHYQSVDRMNHQFGSIPGAVGFFYYSGLMVVVFGGLFLVGSVLFVMEIAVWWTTRNFLLCSLIGMSLANTAAQFGTAPRQMLPHFALIFAVLLLIRIVENGRSTPPLGRADK